MVPCRYTRWIFLLISNLLRVYQRVKNFYYTNNYLVIHVMSGAKGAVAVLDAQTTIASPCFKNWVAVGLSGWVCGCWGRTLGARSRPCFEVVEWSSTLASPISIRSKLWPSTSSNARLVCLVNRGCAINPSVVFCRSLAIRQPFFESGGFVRWWRPFAGRQTRGGRAPC